MRKKKVITIIGVRPEFIRIRPLALQLLRSFEHKIVHTGQHYDYLMSQAFFEELEVARPDYYLGVGSDFPNRRLGEILRRLERVLLLEKPDLVMVHGDSDSTIGGAIAASRLKIPLAHVEAGMRCFDLMMPEEINRKIADHLSTLLFCSSETAAANLKREGIAKNVYICGDLMLDTFLKIKPDESILKRLKFSAGKFYYCTVHREANTESLEIFKKIFNLIVSLDLPVVFPAHPRLNRFMRSVKSRQVRVIDPVTYRESLALIKNTRAVITDSGGIQKEAYWSQVACFTLRDRTEWVETVESGWNKLVLSEIDNLARFIKYFKKPKHSLSLYGDGKASEYILQKVRLFLND